MRNIFWSIIFGALFFLKLGATEIVLQNDSILNQKTVEEIQILGRELLEKTNIFVGVVAIDSLDNKSIKEIIKQYSSIIRYNSCAFILLVKKEHIVEIYQSNDLINDFDKEKVLSPYPNTGTILPILVNVKRGEQPNYSAAILNGYADIVETIAKNKNIELESAIGNTNRNFINVIRYIVYGIIALSVLIYFYHRFRRRQR